MQSGLITNVFLPAALAIIMLGLGLSLTSQDFTRVLRYPRAVAVGLGVQMLILPPVCFFLAKAFGLPPELAVGFMILAASPGGTTANLFSHLAHGDVALNITLTAVNSVLSAFSMPIIVNYALDAFVGGGQIGLQFGKILEVFVIILAPVVIGMLVRWRAPGFAERMGKPVRLASAVFLLLIIIGALAKEWQRFWEFLLVIGPPALLFNVISLGCGYAVPSLVKLDRRQAVAIGMEIGIHNCALAIYIAATILNNPLMSVAPAMYSLVMYITAAGFGWWVNHRHRAELTSAAAS